MARWGMPRPPQFGGQPVTNIRNLNCPHWRGRLGVGNRCLVQATSFCEYAPTTPRKTPTWFALSDDRPLFAFAGLWTRWDGERGPKSALVEGEHELFGFLTTEATPSRSHPSQSHSGDANGRCSVFEVWRRCRSSAQFTPRCTTNSIRSAISSRGKSTSRDALLPWPSGARSRHRSPLARRGSHSMST
jgi:SOS response associated peptidase (SRAP)